MEIEPGVKETNRVPSGSSPGDGHEHQRRIGDSVGMSRGTATRETKCRLQHAGDDVFAIHIPAPGSFLQISSRAGCCLEGT